MNDFLFCLLTFFSYIKASTLNQSLGVPWKFYSKLKIDFFDK